MARYLVNALSINMIPEGGDLAIRKTDRDHAAHLVRSGDFVSAIGHAETMNVVNSDLGSEFEMNRMNVHLEKGDFLLVAQYIGPRLQEGATELPEGAVINYFGVDVK